LDFFAEPLADGERAEYWELVYRAWSASVVRQGMRRPSRERGVRLLGVTDGEVGDYLTNIDPMGAGQELTALSTKDARRWGFGPFDLLRKVRDEGGSPWTELWWQYEKATRGRRMLGWSHGLRARLGVLDEEPDPEALGAPVVGFVRSEDWCVLRWSNRLRGAQAVIEAAASGGQLSIDEAVRVLLGGEPVVEVLVGGAQAEQLTLGPGDDGGNF
jgi:hypothetical protein